MLCCRPDAQARHIVDWFDSLLGVAGEDPAVLMHIGTYYNVKSWWKVIKNDLGI